MDKKIDRQVYKKKYRLQIVDLYKLKFLILNFKDVKMHFIFIYKTKSIKIVLVIFEKNQLNYDEVCIHFIVFWSWNLRPL